MTTNTETETSEHFSKSQIITINLMPPKMSSDELKHGATCDECYGKLKDDAKRRVDLYKTQQAASV